MAATLKQINKAIAAKGIKAELCKGEGYYFAFGDDVQYAYATSINGIAYLNMQSVEEWVKDVELIAADSKEREPDHSDETFSGKVKPTFGLDSRKH